MKYFLSKAQLLSACTPPSNEHVVAFDVSRELQFIQQEIRNSQALLANFQVPRASEKHVGPRGRLVADRGLIRRPGKWNPLLEVKPYYGIGIVASGHGPDHLRPFADRLWVVDLPTIPKTTPRNSRPCVAA